MNAKHEELMELGRVSVDTQSTCGVVADPGALFRFLDAPAV